MNIPEDKIINTVLFRCSECGYETSIHSNRSQHLKTKKCSRATFETIRTPVIKVTDVMELLKNITSTTYNQTANVINNANNNVNITVNLVVPNNSVIGSIQEALANEDCVGEIRGADPTEIPAILFKYTRGALANQKHIRYDPVKDAVHYVDPVTGTETSKNLKKFRNEYLNEQADFYDDETFVDYTPNNVKNSLKDLTRPDYFSGKKVEKPGHSKKVPEKISAGQVIKTYASGSHDKYKFPIETKDFNFKVVKHVDNEIKST